MTLLSICSCRLWKNPGNLSGSGGALEVSELTDHFGDPTELTLENIMRDLRDSFQQRLAQRITYDAFQNASNGSYNRHSMKIVGMRLVEMSEGGDWRARLLKTDGGAVKACLANALLALRRTPEWFHLLAFNQASLRVITKGHTPWGKVIGSCWTDVDDSLTAEWLQLNGINVGSKIAAEAVQTVAKERSFHPIRDYLNGLNWDGNLRLMGLFPDYFGTEANLYTKTVGMCWPVSAVARVFRPGCQSDHTLVLEGPQGILKSSALRELAGDEYFTGHISDLSSKDSRLELRGKWIIEFSEFNRLRRSEKEEIKSFLTARFDDFRPPYGLRTERFARECVFAATTNDSAPLIDETGNRRFWPVRCGRIKLDALISDRDQLWAESVQLYRVGHKWWLDTDELIALADQEQDAL